jgi:ribosomal protein L22
MADEEKQPRPRRRLRKKDEDAPEVEASSAPETTEDEIEATREDVGAEEVTEVVLEADDEAEEEPEAETEAAEELEAGAEEQLDAEAEPEAAPEEDAEEAKPARRRRRRGAAAVEEAEKPTAPAPTRRRRSQRDPSLPPPVVRAQAKYVRSSARKARLVCDHIRGKTVDEARAILAHTPRAVARDWSKLLESAVANAEHNHELVGEDLYVKAVHADEGPTIKRFRPRAMGRATRIRKRTSHLTILLTPKD